MRSATAAPEAADLIVSRPRPLHFSARNSAFLLEIVFSGKLAASFFEPGGNYAGTAANPERDQVDARQPRQALDRQEPQPTRTAEPPPAPDFCWAMPAMSGFASRPS